MADEWNVDQQEAVYHDAIEAWIAAIRREETLATSTTTVAELDAWEEAARAEDEARNRVQQTKKAYEEALRQKFFHF